MTATYSHIGGLIHAGYRHRSNRLYGHTCQQAGKTHALTADGHGWKAACGEVLPSRCEDEFGFDRPTPVCEATDAAGTGVTCARCRKLLKVQRHAIQFASYGRWTTVKDAKFGTKAEAEARKADLQREYPTAALRIRLV
jgi:hypothetical protein